MGLLVGYSVFDEKAYGTITRIQLSRVGISIMIVSKILTGIVCGCVQIVSAFVFSSFVLWGKMGRNDGMDIPAPDDAGAVQCAFQRGDRNAFQKQIHVSEYKDRWRRIALNLLCCCMMPHASMLKCVFFEESIHLYMSFNTD